MTDRKPNVGKLFQAAASRHLAEMPSETWADKWAQVRFLFRAFRNVRLAMKYPEATNDD